MLNLGERITMVKHSARVEPVDETADALHSAAVRLLRRVRAADLGLDLDGPVRPRCRCGLRRSAAAEPARRRGAGEPAGDDQDRRGVGSGRPGAAGTPRRRPPVVLVTATDAGRQLLARGRAARVRLVGELIAGLPDRDRRTLHRAAAILLARVAG
jgi:hypothetical protein